MKKTLKRLSLILLAALMTAAFVFTVFAADGEPGGEEAAQNPEWWASLLQFAIPILLMVAIFYFLLYKPQKKQEKAVVEMRSSLKVGDSIVTNGGIMGKIVRIKDDCITIESGNDKTKFDITQWAVKTIEKSTDASEEK